MTNRKSIASLLIFVGTALCFFLPFVTVSCGGITAFTLNGQQLATGTTLTQQQAFGPPQRQKIDGDPFAAFAAVCALVGIALSLIGKRIAGANAVCGGVGAVSLLIMRSRLVDQLQKQSQGLATAKFETGFTFAVLLLIAAAAWNAYLLVQNRRIKAQEELGGGANDARNAPTERGSPPELAETPPSRSSPEYQSARPGSSTRSYCSQCGQEIRVGARFCESCGRPAEAQNANDQVQSAFPGGTA